MFKAFKKHLTLIIGTFLPVMLASFLGITSLMPSLLVKPPQCDLLYLISPYPHEGVNTEIEDKKLKVWITPAVIKGTLPMPRLFLYDVKAKTSIEIPLRLPQFSKHAFTNQRVLLDVPALEELRIDPSSKSPDGYKAASSIPNEGGIANFAFSNSYKRNFSITKNNHAVSIFDEANNIYNYKHVKFLGWVLSNKDNELPSNQDEYKKIMQASEGTHNT